MREAFTLIFIGLIAALGVCAFIAKRSGKTMGPSVSFSLISTIPPVIGNLIIIASTSEIPATIGCYIYFLGMDLIVFSYLRFTFKYCNIKWPNKIVWGLVHGLIIADAIQLLLNPFFHHAFTTEELEVYGKPYFRLVPYAGQTIHRILDYGIVAAMIIIFIVMVIKTPRIHSERYWIILICLLLAVLWQTFYIFSRTPIDRSMIGFAAFGLAVYYFSLYYRPMRLLDRMLAGIASEMPDGLYFFDSSGQCIWANEPALQLLDLKLGIVDKAGGKLDDYFGQLDHKELEWAVRKVVESGDKTRYYILEKHSIYNRNGKEEGSFISVRDNTEEQELIRKEKYNATHDRLTDLYNKEYLYQRIHEVLQDNPETAYYIIYIDINEFKIVNDIFGKDFGDLALRKLADWLRADISQDFPSGKPIIYGRLSGDTFGVLVPKMDFDHDRIVSEILGFKVNDGTREHSLLIHLGVYEVHDIERDVSIMFDRAHMALIPIKNDYQQRINYYDEEMRNKVIWDQYLTGQLKTALEEKQIQPYLQPIVDMNGKVMGAEALVRWIHPDEGFLSPAAFVPVFEKNGMIAEIDKYMWRSACEIISGWGENRKDMFISVNISPKDFYFMNVKDEICSLVEEYHIDPARLRLEITETVMMSNIDNRVRMINEMRDAGFIVEMDDFGSGYSSLNLLKDMPVDIIKIDMTFLRKTKDSDRARIILKNIIHMTRDLGIVSLTEGVETPEQHQMLVDMGCQLFQGYHFARPMQIDGFEAFCDTQRA